MEHKADKTNVINSTEEDNLSVGSEDALSQTKVYKRRWYILLVYSLICILQGYLTIIWSVTAVSVKAVFGWGNGDISRIVNWNAILFFVAIIPFIGLTTKAGFRVTVLMGAGFLLAGTIIRCISFKAPLVTHLADAGQILNGLAGPVCFCGGILISDRWFPPKERSTATAIGVIISYLGNTLCFLICPSIVPQPDKNHHHNNTNIITNITNFSECGIAVVIFLLVLLYFPDRPKLPPSQSASEHEDELNLIQSTKQLFCNKKNKDYWYVVLALAIPGGIATSWAALVVIILTPVGVTQVDAGYLGFVGGVSALVGTVTAGRIADFFIGRLKPVIMILVTVCVLSTYWTILLVIQYIPYDRASMYVATVIWGASCNGMFPLSFELMIENAYPVPAVVSTGVATLVYQIPSIISLVALSVKHFPIWTFNWAIFVSNIVSFFLILITREHYNRLKMDIIVSPENNKDK